MLSGIVIEGKWQVSHRIGQGGMGSVFAATHRNGKRVAIKVLHSELHANERVRGRFLREGYIANRVDHADVVSVLDDGVTPDGDAFLVMELLVGETLEVRRKRVPLSVAEALVIADRVLDVLASAHDRGIVHRDIKPANIFLTTTGAVKVLDFGIASLREVLVEAEGSTLTPNAGSLGTPSFMPPEQARGRWDLVDGRTDLWALGAVLFTLLTGRLVHQGLTANELLIAAATTPATPLSSLCPAAPRSVARLIDRALTLDSAHRWQDARAMQRAVRSAIATLMSGEFAPSTGERFDSGAATLPEKRESFTVSSTVSPARRSRRLLTFAAAIVSSLALTRFAAFGLASADAVKHLGAARVTSTPAFSLAAPSAPTIAVGSSPFDSVTGQAAPRASRGITPERAQSARVRSLLHARSQHAVSTVPSESAAFVGPPPPVVNDDHLPAALWRPESEWLDRQQ